MQVKSSGRPYGPPYGPPPGPIQPPAAPLPAHPCVSLLIAMRNEAGRIEACLESIFNQDYPDGLIEVYVMDGRSTDNSWRLVEEIFAGRANCHLLDNPRVFQAAGWNLGLLDCHGDVIGIVSAHAELAPDYVSTAIETLQRTQAEMVGGPARAIGVGYVARAIAAATSTPFGVGSARFRYTREEGYLDTVFMGLCRREVYDQIGGFDEDFVRAEDAEFSYRITRFGGQIYCNPAIRSSYYNRTTLTDLASQYYRYGFWKVRVMHKHPRQMHLRHFVPASLLAGLVAAGLADVLLSMPVSWLLTACLAYLGATLLASVWTAYRFGLRYLPLLPVVFMILHISYGAGFWAGLAAFAIRRLQGIFRRPTKDLP